MLRLRVIGVSALLALGLCGAAFAAQSPAARDDEGRPGSIAGRILRPDGAPAPEARVWIAWRTPTGELAAMSDAVVAAFDGQYKITGVPAGSYLVAAQPAPGSFFGHDEASRAAVTAVTLFPGVPASDGGTPVRVFEGIATEGIDIWLSPAPQRFEVFARVYDPEDRRLSDMHVEYTDLAGVRSGVWIVSDPDGYFVIEGVPPGTFLMLARAASPDGPLVGAAATEVTAGRVEDVRIVMRPPGSVEGRLVVEAPSAPSFADVRVSLVHTLFEVSLFYPREEATPAADGRFVLPRAYGKYGFEVSGLPDGWRVLGVRRNGRALADGELTVGQDERITGIEIVVGP